MQRASEFGTLAQEAHRHPALVAGAPALIRHRGIWVRESPLPELAAARSDALHDSKNIRSLMELNSQREILLDFVDGIISLFKILRLVGVHDTMGTLVGSSYLTHERTILGNIAWARSDFLSTRCVIGGCLLKMRVQIHNDYITITESIDLSKTSSKSTTLSFMPNLRSRIELAFRQLADDRNPSSWPAAMKELRTGIWDQLDDQISLGRLADHASAVPEQFPIETFCDFRGIVLGSHQDNGATRLRWEPASPRMQKPSSVRLSDRRWSRAEQHEAVEAFWPRLQAMDANLQDREVIVSSMLNGRAIYVSTLGAQPRGTQGSQGDDPLCYSLLVSVDSRWQIGRLIDRINHLGTVRLLALRDLRAIQLASIQIRALGLELDKLEQEIRGTSGEALKLSINDLFKKIESIGSMGSGGLSYRINRSRHLVGIFKTMLVDLRIGRIEGFQPYDAFVRRRLYATYDFIDRVGLRVDQLRARAVAAFEAVQTASALASQESLKQSQLRIEQLQEIADKVGWVAVTYYGGTILWQGVEVALKIPPDQGKLWKLAGFLVAGLLWWITVTRRQSGRPGHDRRV